MSVLFVILLTAVSEINALYIQKETCKDNGGTEFSVIFLEQKRTGEPIRLYINTHTDVEVKVKVSTPTWLSSQSVNLDVNVTSGTTSVVELPDDLRLTTNGIANKVVRIVATDNIFLHASDIQANSGDAFLLYPVSVVGTEYLVPSVEENNFLVGIVAIQDNTLIQVELPSGAHTEISRTVYQREYNVTLNSLQVLFLNIKSADFVLIKAENVVSVFSGHKFEHVNTISGTTGDHTQEQILPLQYWSKEYIVAPSLGYSYNGYGEHVKIYGYFNETTVEISNSSSMTVLELGVPGEFHKFFVKSGEAFVIRSDKVIGVFQYGVASPTSYYPSDAYLLQVSGTDQYVQYATFPTILSTDNILNNSFLLVSSNNAINEIFYNNELIASTWIPAGGSDYSFTYVNLSDSLSLTESHNILNTSNGNGLFTAVITGVDQAIQYAAAVGKYLAPSEQLTNQTDVSSGKYSST